MVQAVEEGRNGVLLFKEIGLLLFCEIYWGRTVRNRLAARIVLPSTIFADLHFDFRAKNADNHRLNLVCYGRDGTMRHSILLFDIDSKWNEWFCLSLLWRRFAICMDHILIKVEMWLDMPW